MPIIPRCPLRRPAEQHEQAAQDDCRDAAPTAQHVRWMGLPFVLQCLLSMQVQRKPFCSKARQVTAARHTSRKKGHIPLGKEEEEHWIILLWVLTLGCKIHLPFFRLPLSPPQVLSSFSVSTPSSQPSTPCPLSGSCRDPLQMTHLKQEKKERAGTENQAAGREVDIVCLWFSLRRCSL